MAAARIRTLAVAMVFAAAALVTVAAPAGAAPSAEGKDWRELYTTTGLSWSQVASVCPTDGATPCSGSVGGVALTGWTWGTAAQVTALLDDYWPGIVTADPPVLSGIDGFGPAIAFLGDMRWTSYTSLTYSYSEYTAGWTASRDAAGVPIGAGAGWSTQLTGTTTTGSIGLGSAADVADPSRGVFLWRPTGADQTAPVITPHVTGTLGNEGWYRSDVALTWSVTDPESAIVSTSGCDPTTLLADTAGDSYTCTATSGGLDGAASASLVLRRDTVAPTVACGAEPTFAFGAPGATVSAAASDATSGVASTSVSAVADTFSAGRATVVVAAMDRAGNVGSAACGYRVQPPRCAGVLATVVGTNDIDTLVGTAGDDVILALGGSDTIQGGAGTDRVCAGDRADVVYAGGGADRVYGEAGDDDLNGGPGNDLLDGGDGLDSIRGDGGPDTCLSGEVRSSSCANVS